MNQPRCHLAIPSRTDRLVMVARRLVAMAFAGLLAAIPAWTQSAGNPAPAPTAQAQTSAPSTPSPSPDKGRARKAFQAGRRAEQSGDWKAEFAAYSEAATYDPSNREYKMLKEHARFQVLQSLVDGAERQAVAGNIPGARALLTQALEVDPNYVVAQERLAELTPSPAEEDAEKGPRLAGLPRLIVKKGTQAFDYRGTTRGAYEEIGKQFGVKMVFDGDLPDRAIAVPGSKFGLRHGRDGPFTPDQDFYARCGPAYHVRHGGHGAERAGLHPRSGKGAPPPGRRQLRRNERNGPDDPRDDRHHPDATEFRDAHAHRPQHGTKRGAGASSAGTDRAAPRRIDAGN